VLDLHLCGMYGADDLLARKISVRGRETRNPDPPTRHSLQVRTSPTLILIPTLIFACGNLSCFKRETEEGKKTYETTFPNVHRSQTKDPRVRLDCFFFYIPVRCMIVKRKRGAATRIAMRSISQNQPTNYLIPL